MRDKLQNIIIVALVSFLVPTFLLAQIPDKSQIRSLVSSKQVGRAIIVWDQIIYKCHIRPIVSNNQIQKTDSNYLEIRKAYIKGKHVFIKLKNKKIIILHTDSVIGFQIKEDSSYLQIRNGEFYTVFQLNDLILYYRKVDKGKYVETYYYFSYNLNSEIYWISEENVTRLFIENTCILKKLSRLSVFESLTEWDKKNETLRFMVWYNECKSATKAD